MSSIDDSNYPVAENGQASGLLSSRFCVRAEPLPPIPPETRTKQRSPWELAALQPEGLKDGKVLFHLAAVAPAEDSRSYRLALEENAASYREAMDSAYGTFLGGTDEGRRLVAVRLALEEAESLVSEAQANAKAAERQIRSCITAGRDPASTEESLRRARQDCEIYSLRVNAAREALVDAEAQAQSALRNRLEGVRQKWINEAKHRFEHSAKQLMTAIAEQTLACAQAIAADVTAKQPVPDALLRLPG